MSNHDEEEEDAAVHVTTDAMLAAARAEIESLASTLRRQATEQVPHLVPVVGTIEEEEREKEEFSLCEPFPVLAHKS